jgi:hypothetical protein
MVGNIQCYLIAIYLVFLFRISFDQNGFHVNPKHLVGHSYVIFHNHVSPPVYLLFTYLGAIWLYFTVVLVVLFDNHMRFFSLCIGAFDNDSEG